MVVLDFEHPNHSVALMQPKDKGAFERAIAKGNAKDPSNKLVYETFHGWTVMAEKQAAIDGFEQASDSAQRTLSDDATFRGALSKAGDGIFRAYVNGGAVMNAASTFLGPDGKGYLAKLGKLDWLTTSLRAKPDGIAWDTVVHGTPGKQFKGVDVHPSSGGLQKFVPKDALLYLAFRGTRGMTRGLADNPILMQPGFEDLGKVFEQLGTILQGKNALYVRAARGRYPEVTFLAAPGGGVDGAATLDRVLKRFANELGARPRRTSIAGLPARVIGTGPLSLRYANVGGKLVVTDFPSGILFTKNGGKALAESDEYRQAARSSGLPAKPTVMLYVDARSSVPVIEKLGGSRLPADVARNLKPLRSALEYAVSRSHEFQVTFFLRIQ